MMIMTEHTVGEDMEEVKVSQFYQSLTKRPVGMKISDDVGCVRALSLAQPEPDIKEGGMVEWWCEMGQYRFQPYPDEEETDEEFYQGYMVWLIGLVESKEKELGLIKDMLRRATEQVEYNELVRKSMSVWYSKSYWFRRRDGS